MSEEKHESLSALIDGEISDEAETHLLDQVLEDESLSRRWASYHLIGDILRRHAHGNKERTPATFAAEVVPRRAIKPGRATVLGPVGGLALAASVALVAILGIHALTSQDAAVVQTAAVESGVASANTASPATDARPVTGERSAALPVRLASTHAATAPVITRLTWNDAAPAVTTRLNGYLVTHNEYLANGMRGMLPYARIVAYDGRGN